MAEWFHLCLPLWPPISLPACPFFLSFFCSLSCHTYSDFGALAILGLWNPASHEISSSGHCVPGRHACPCLTWSCLFIFLSLQSICLLHLWFPPVGCKLLLENTSQGTFTTVSPAAKSAPGTVIEPLKCEVSIADILLWIQSIKSGSIAICWVKIQMNKYSGVLKYYLKAINANK